MWCCQKSKSEVNLPGTGVTCTETAPLSYQCEHNMGVDKETRQGRKGPSEGNTGSRCWALQGTARWGVSHSSLGHQQLSVIVSSVCHCCWSLGSSEGPVPCSTECTSRHQVWGLCIVRMFCLVPFVKGFRLGLRIRGRVSFRFSILVITIIQSSAKIPIMGHFQVNLISLIIIWLIWENSTFVYPTNQSFYINCSKHSEKDVLQVVFFLDYTKGTG